MTEDKKQHIKDELHHIKEDIEEKKDELHERIKRRNKRRVQIVTVTVILVFLTVVTIFCLPLVREWRTEEGLEKLKETMSAKYTGIESMFIFVLLQAVQVIIAVIPPIQIVGGALFGWFLGFLLSFAGVMLGTFVIYEMVRHFGMPLVEAFVDEKHLKKFKFLQDEDKLIRILAVLYLIPGIVPKDVISYIVPLTKVKKRDFFLYVMPCRIPAVLLSTVLGNNAIDGNFKTVIIIASGALVAGIAGFILKEPIMNSLKKKKAQD